MREETQTDIVNQSQYKYLYITLLKAVQKTTYKLWCLLHMYSLVLAVVIVHMHRCSMLVCVPGVRLCAVTCKVSVPGDTALCSPCSSPTECGSADSAG